MHELSIAQSVVDFVNSETERNGARRVDEIYVEVGELMQVDTKVLADGLTMLMTGPSLKGATVHISPIEAVFSCAKCGARWGMSEAKKQLSSVPGSLLVQEPDSSELPLHFLPQLYSSFVSCPKCGSADISVTQGEEIRLVRVVME